ncbi:hypothetical protein QQS21_001686 [Conoideocrella luteorostrata]|uniref:Microtubule associated protein n=1 Tax=Conoideocrella luteorostrata TaxID=1105319 RepID=A0AAJ0CZC7_9HYPO|nr:hypothetical protein QQS21_001686 [Conoideocrella luteorostrata]
MAVPSKPPANKFVASMRGLYNPIGFSKGYNFILWFIFSGAMMGFCLARFMYLNYDGVYCSPDASTMNHAAPGECWKYNTKDVYKIGIKMHLYTIIPAGFLVCFQFVPFIRYKAILFHRINGYIVLLLSVAGTAGGLMIGRIAFGGGIEVQTAVGLLAIMFLISLAISLYNVKMLQLEQHRAWMLRAWFYSGSIITTRLITFITAQIISSKGTSTYYEAFQCDELASFYNTTESLIAKYPECRSTSAWVAVPANMNARSAENIGAALRSNFGMALWLALALHAIGVEVYLHLTPAEADRLRNVSYQRQLEAGFSNAGRAGLTTDRIGDAAIWTPANDKKDVAAVAPSVSNDSVMSASRSAVTRV